MIKTESERVEIFDRYMKMAGIDDKDFSYWLYENGFFTAPASAKYHGAYKGGLFDHSLNVTEELLYLTRMLGLEWDLHRSPYIIGMFHDLCKIDKYKIGKDGMYTYRNGVADGHGSKSVAYLSKFLSLTEEEKACIRFHMGAYETDDWDKYDKAIRRYPNVLYTHTADMVASKIIESKEW